MGNYIIIEMSISNNYVSKYLGAIKMCTQIISLVICEKKFKIDESLKTMLQIHDKSIMNTCINTLFVKIIYRISEK